MFSNPNKSNNSDYYSVEVPFFKILYIYYYISDNSTPFRFKFNQFNMFIQNNINKDMKLI